MKVINNLYKNVQTYIQYNLYMYTKMLTRILYHIILYTYYMYINYIHNM